MTNFAITVSNPTAPRPADLDDRWVWSEPYCRVKSGTGPTETYRVDLPGTSPMRVTTVTKDGTKEEVVHIPNFQIRSRPHPNPTICPIWGDVVPYRSATVVVPPELELDAVYSLEYVHGGGSVVDRKVLPDGSIALRSDYQAW